jgi:acetyltransferase-like isoleucine patch superfamily enzyme
MSFNPYRALFAILAAAIKPVLRSQRLVVRRATRRVLPTNELASDPNEKARFLGFGAGSRVYDSCCVYGDVHVGRDTWVGPYTVLDGASGLHIGDGCCISAGAHIYTHDSVQWCVSGGAVPFAYAPVTIGNRCYIGPNAVIAMGVVLGDGCVVGANSFVNASFPANAKVAGNPARLI